MAMKWGVLYTVYEKKFCHLTWRRTEIRRVENDLAKVHGYQVMKQKWDPRFSDSKVHVQNVYATH